MERSSIKLIINWLMKSEETVLHLFTAWWVNTRSFCFLRNIRSFFFLSLCTRADSSSFSPSWNFFLQNWLFFQLRFSIILTFFLFFFTSILPFIWKELWHLTSSYFWNFPHLQNCPFNEFFQTFSHDYFDFSLNFLNYQDFFPYISDLFKVFLLLSPKFKLFLLVILTPPFFPEFQFFPFDPVLSMHVIVFFSYFWL